MNDQERSGLVLLALAAVIAIISFCRGACVGQDSATNALEKQGYSQIVVTDHDWFLVGLRGCDAKDAAKFTAKVVNPVGKQTEVFVCVGWPFKGATVRTD